MKIKTFIGLGACFFVLAACAPSTDKKLEEANNFKPYVFNQQYALPGAYAKEAWAYPAGTPTKAVIARWKSANLIMGATNVNGMLHVLTGPQFYNLSASSQRGLADTVSQIYGANHYLMMDFYRERAVAMYTPEGLQLY
jgi:hypothetical protein